MPSVRQQSASKGVRLAYVAVQHDACGLVAQRVQHLECKPQRTRLGRDS